jgi:hypothetical protein
MTLVDNDRPKSTAVSPTIEKIVEAFCYLDGQMAGCTGGAGGCRVLTAFARSKNSKRDNDLVSSNRIAIRQSRYAKLSLALFAPLREAIASPGARIFPGCRRVFLSQLAAIELVLVSLRPGAPVARGEATAPGAPDLGKSTTIPCTSKTPSYSEIPSATDPPR